jgi:phosphoribosyl-AMP cyclohydrolase
MDCCSRPRAAEDLTAESPPRFGGKDALSLLAGWQAQDGDRFMSKAGSKPGGVLAAIRFDDAGLVPAIAQRHDTGEVLTLAWMNRDAVAETLATRRVCYWSRSRQQLWRKGEKSGQIQRLVEMRLDCDNDALLLRVEQTGVACHTGRRSCFFQQIQSDGEIQQVLPVEVDPGVLYGD